MEVREAIQMLRQAADELEEYSSHECYNDDAKLVIVVHDKDFMKHCDIEKMNFLYSKDEKGNYIHGGYYRKHLFLNFIVKIDKDHYPNEKQHTWNGSKQ